MTVTGKRWIVVMEDGDKITITKDPMGPSQGIVEGAGKRLASLGKSGYLVSLNGPLTSDESSEAVEEAQFGTPTVPFTEVMRRLHKRGTGKQGWRF